MKSTNKFAAAVTVLIALCIPSALRAQAPEQSQILSDLQKQMEAMRTEMNAMQERIRELQGKKDGKAIDSHPKNIGLVFWRNQE